MEKDWTGNTKITYMSLGASNHSEKERETNDYYATDPKALKIFLDKLTRDNIQLHENIWEPACGEGHLSKLFKAEGYKIISSDLIDRGFGTPNIDFLKTDKKWQ